MGLSDPSKLVLQFDRKLICFFTHFSFRDVEESRLKFQTNRAWYRTRKIMCTNIIVEFNKKRKKENFLDNLQ